MGASGSKRKQHRERSSSRRPRRGLPTEQEPPRPRRCPHREEEEDEVGQRDAVMRMLVGASEDKFGEALDYWSHRIGLCGRHNGRECTKEEPEGPEVQGVYFSRPGSARLDQLSWRSDREWWRNSRSGVYAKAPDQQRMNNIGYDVEEDGEGDFDGIRLTEKVPQGQQEEEESDTDESSGDDEDTDETAPDVDHESVESVYSRENVEQGRDDGKERIRGKNRVVDLLCGCVLTVCL